MLKATPSPVDPVLIESIRAHHRTAAYALKQQQRMDRALESFIVFNVLNMPYDADKTERARIWKRALAMIDGAIGRVKNQCDIAPSIIAMIEANKAARAPYDAMRNLNDRELKRLVRQLPAWPRMKLLVPSGEISFGRLIAEAGDLANYATVSKLWKRMGLAVFNGARQGNPGKQATANDWIAHGYVPRRRSISWVIGAALMKGNKRYRAVYLARKAYELARTDDGKPMSKMHAHRRAQRVMEKRFLRDLWSAWREPR